MINRREFIKYSAAFGGAISYFPMTGSMYRQTDMDQQLYWYNKPLRILQTVLREPDAADYDAGSVVEYLQKSGCNTLVVNGGGIVDFFRNPLPAANINPYMGKRDILREITTECHKAGIKVIARIDFRGVEEKIYREFPEWFSLDHNRMPKQLTYTRPNLYASCYTGYYRNEHAIEFINYLMKNYDLDGIWHNSVGVGGICYCDRCIKSFRSFSGEDIPDLSDESDDRLDIYMKWKAEMADNHMNIMKKTVKSFGNDRAYSAEVFNMFNAGEHINDGIDLYNAREHFDFLISVAFLTENSEIIRYDDITYAATIVKFLKSMAPEKEAVILYGGNGTSHRYVMEPASDLKVWLWEALASGGRFWNCNFTGMHPAATYDRRTALHHSDTYRFVAENEKILAQHAPWADIGIYYSKATRMSFRSKSVEGDIFGSFIKGMETVMNENHILYDFIADDQISGDRLAKYKVVLLPDVRCLSDKEMTIIKNYVRDGGNIIATYETSLYDITGSARKDFGLAELFGCHYTGEKVNTRKDCYQYISEREHPVVRPDSDDSELLLNAGYTLLCRPVKEAMTICNYVPVVHNQPPEKAWISKWENAYPTILENTYYKGKSIYFANQPDLLSFEMGHPDMRNLLVRSIRYLAGAGLVLETTAPESVHAGLTRSVRSPGDFIFSLVNTTSAPLRPLRSLIPVFNIRAVLDAGRVLKNYKVLRSDGKTGIEFKNGRIEISVDKLEDFFSVHLITE